MNISHLTTRRTPLRKAAVKGYCEVQLSHRLDTSWGYIFWNPARIVYAVPVALLMAFIVLIAATYLSSLVVGPVLSGFCGMLFSLASAVVTGASVLVEGFRK